MYLYCYDYPTIPVVMDLPPTRHVANTIKINFTPHYTSRA